MVKLKDNPEPVKLEMYSFTDNDIEDHNRHNMLVNKAHNEEVTLLYRALNDDLREYQYKHGVWR